MDIKKDEISCADFEKIDIRVGIITNAEKFHEAKKPAYKITIDFGEIGIKKSSAQITKLYSPEELIRKQIIAVVNFPSKQIANLQSECLISGVINKNKDVILLQPQRKTINGLRIG